MRQLQQDFNSGDVDLVDVPTPTLRPDGVLVETTYSLVSAGTERAMLNLGQKTLLGKALERPDLAREVVQKLRHDGVVSTYRSVQSRLNEPRPLGYSCVGEVLAVGDEVDDLSVGDTVACGGAGYASHAEVNYVPSNLCVEVPDGVDQRAASFVTLGAIAMQGVRRLDATPGERIAVIGLGLVGHLVSKILDAYGYQTLGLDIDPTTIEDADHLDTGAVIGDDDVSAVVDNFTDGVGVDGVVIAAATESNQPVEMAGEIVREQGTVAVVGDVGMDVPRSEYYEKELDFRVSRSYGPGRYDRRYEEEGLDYPIEFVRWTERRNMREFLRLIGDERLSVDEMVTHTFSVDDALDAYDLILNGEERFLGVVIEYAPDRTADWRRVEATSSEKQSVSGDLSFGLIGTGNFARSVLLPTLDGIDGLDLRAVVSASGENSQAAAEEYGAAYASTDYEEVIADDEIDFLVVATRHNLHAEIAEAALRAGVDVHVEKPPALDESELSTLVAAEAASTARLTVGYNRRFSRAARAAREEFQSRSGPLIGRYRVNVDRLPNDHWVYDPAEGGGRIVGEVCHFVDFLQYVTDSRPTDVYAASPGTVGDFEASDNVQTVIRFEDGSQATITYTAAGDSSVSKERVELFGDGRIEVVDNFNYGPLGLRQDKGFTAQFEALAESINDGTASPIPIESIVSVSSTTFAIEESIRADEPVTVDGYGAYTEE